MPQSYDITMQFTFPPVKVIFEEIFLKTVFSSKLKILTKNGKKESNYKDLVYSEKWMSLIISEPYYNNSRKWRKGEDIQELINAFFDFLAKYFSSIEWVRKCSK